MTFVKYIWIVCRNSVATPMYCIFKLFINLSSSYQMASRHSIFSSVLSDSRFVSLNKCDFARDNLFLLIVELIISDVFCLVWFVNIDRCTAFKIKSYIWCRYNESSIDFYEFDPFYCHFIGGSFHWEKRLSFHFISSIPLNYCGLHLWDLFAL